MDQQPHKEIVTRDIKLKGRTVLIKIKVEKAGRPELVEIPALFHVWGFRKSKHPDPKVITMETVAVCELPDGKIRLVMPEKVKFLDTL